MVCCCYNRCSFFISSNSSGTYNCRIDYYNSDDVFIYGIRFTETSVNNFPIGVLSSFFSPYPIPALIGINMSLEEARQALYYKSCSSSEAYRFKDVFEEVEPLIPFFNEIRFDFKFSSSSLNSNYSISFDSWNTARTYKYLKGTIIFYTKPKDATCVTPDDISGYSSSPFIINYSTYRCSSPVDNIPVVELISSYCINEFKNAKI